MAMLIQRTATTPAPTDVHDEATLPDGRLLVRGAEVSISGEHGRYRFVYERRGDLTFFGPIGADHSSWRTFRPERVRTVHRKRRGSR